MRAKSFFYVSLGILALALAYHFGATTAGAQAPGNPVVAYGLGKDYGNNGSVLATADGDVYFAPKASGPWMRVANVFKPRK
jgi:hypothetical protein